MLGSGQLGRMFAIAARRMGYRVVTFSPDADSPTGQCADREIVANYDDLDAVAAFARSVDVVTYEFENVPTATAAAAARHAPVRPDPCILSVAQNRIAEKEFFRGAGFPVPPFGVVRTADDLAAAVASVGTPAVIKTATSGYDGKGQARIASPDEAPAAWESIDRSEAVVEAFVDFAAEVSVIVARDAAGNLADWGVVGNEHANHILDVSTAPAPVSPPVAAEAVRIAHGIATELRLVGVLCVEFFLTRDDALLVNEIAPRPHNSGHLTFDAAVTCQFEQQLRAVCGLPLGSTALMQPAAMANLLGDVWDDGPPDWAAALEDPAVKLHLYGKSQPRPGRKMGHLTATAPPAAEARRRVIAARARLQRRAEA
ncbi:MAG: 5-(carboxyamino)imidazole ribonucleotide synthase [Pirellulales bacterium]